jgi:predicted Ser/Thr protein kinase
MTTHCLIINYLKATFRNDPEEMTRILMNTRNYQLKKVRQSNLENNPFHYSEDELCEDHEWNDDW